MSNSIIKVATTLSLMAFLSLSGEGGVVQKAEAAGAWWKCPSGQYQLEVDRNRNSARWRQTGGKDSRSTGCGMPGRHDISKRSSRQNRLLSTDNRHRWTAGRLFQMWSWAAGRKAARY